MNPEVGEKIETRSTIQILEDTSSEINRMKEQAEEANEKGNGLTGVSIWVNRAFLVRNLSYRVSKASDWNTVSQKERIFEVLESLSMRADDALYSGPLQRERLLAKGADHKNDLERLIEFVKNESPEMVS